MAEPIDLHDPRRSIRAAAGAGLLGELNAAGLLHTPDVQVADRLATLADELDRPAQLALALAVRALREGSVALDLADLDPPTQAAIAAGASARGIPWPAAPDWVAAVAASRLAGSSVLQVEHGLVYLDRYWREERVVADTLRARIAQQPPLVDEALLQAGADRVFPTGFEEQRVASESAVRRWTALVTGGPGTGKTTAVAGLLALLAEQAQARDERPLRVALTAPTGKAAARLQEAVAAATARLPEPDRQRLGTLPGLTVHRLLGWRPGGGSRFRHDRGNRLPHDVVVVDETSMVSLTLMARLLEAVRPQTRLVLVCDPDQLSSVEAGAVLADLVAGLTDATGPDPAAVSTLRTTHRFGAGIEALAAAVRDGDDTEAIRLLRNGAEGITWLDPNDPATQPLVRDVAVEAALALRTAAEAGEQAAALAALDRHRLLCAHRHGPVGAASWNRLVERWLTDATGVGVGPAWGREWYAGRPLIVTENDYGLGLYNGDTGVVLADPSAGPGRNAGPGLTAVVAAAGEPIRLATSRLASVETMHALTIHKSQGSQAQEVTVVLPDDDSRLLTRELLYTAITRAQQHVRVVATEQALRWAIASPAQRASGLRRRLTG